MLKIVTLCSCGLGTCFVLKMKVEMYAASRNLEAQVTPCDISSASLEEADLYVAPFGLDLSFAGLSRQQVVVVQDLLDDDELNKKLDEHIFGKDGLNG